MKIDKYYNVESVEDRATLLGVLYSKGAIFHRTMDNYSLERACKEHIRFSELRLEFDGHGFDISGTRTGKATLSWPSQSKEILDELKEVFKTKKPIVINNVGDYTATIDKDGIKVGCQTISFAKFQEIANGVKEFQKK